MHCYDVHDASYLNCENHGLWNRGLGPKMGLIWSYSKHVLDIRTFPSLFHETLYHNCEIHGPWARGSDPRVGTIWSFGKNVLDIKKSSLFLYIFEKN